MCRSLKSSLNFQKTIKFLYDKIGFYKVGLPLPFLSRLTFSLSTKCNRHCSFCPKTTFGIRGGERDIPTDVLGSVLTNVSRTGINFVNIVGLGEPLTSSNFLKSVRWLKRDNEFVSFTTNGLLLNGNIAKELCELKVNEIEFSIEGAKKSTHMEMKDSDFDLLIKNIKRIASVRLWDKNSSLLSS